MINAVTRSARHLEMGGAYAFQTGYSCHTENPYSVVCRSGKCAGAGELHFYTLCVCFVAYYRIFGYSLAFVKLLSQGK